MKYANALKTLTAAAALLALGSQANAWETASGTTSDGTQVCSLRFSDSPRVHAFYLKWYSSSSDLYLELDKGANWPDGEEPVNVLVQADDKPGLSFLMSSDGQDIIALGTSEYIPGGIGDLLKWIEFEHQITFSFPRNPGLEHEPKWSFSLSDTHEALAWLSFCKSKIYAAAELEKAHQAAIKQAEADQVARGYKPMAFDDFVLDGHELADSQAKVAVKGIYKKVGQMPKLFPNAMSVLRQRWDEGLPLLIEDDANRNTRKFLLDCDRDIAERGCQITLLGHATMCRVTNFAGSQDVPCIKVEDGWNVGD